MGVFFPGSGVMKDPVASNSAKEQRTARVGWRVLFRRAATPSENPKRPFVHSKVLFVWSPGWPWLCWRGARGYSVFHPI